MNQNSDDDRRSRSGIVLSLLMTLLISGAAYISTYFLISDAWRPGPGPGPHRIRMRVFPHGHLAKLYRPLTWIESKFRGYYIIPGDKEQLFRSSP